MTRSVFAAADDPVDIINWRRFSPTITTSGLPTEAQLARLKALGVTQVINLGLHSHDMALTDEAGALAGLGLAYTHIPVDFAAPGEKDFERFTMAMAAACNEKVHVHCIYNARVSAFLYRQMRDGPERYSAATLMDSVWRPGGVWAGFIGKTEDMLQPDRYAGRDY